MSDNDSPVYREILLLANCCMQEVKRVGTSMLSGVPPSDDDKRLMGVCEHMMAAIISMPKE